MANPHIDLSPPTHAELSEAMDWWDAFDIGDSAARNVLGMYSDGRSEMARVHRDVFVECEAAIERNLARARKYGADEAFCEKLRKMFHAITAYIVDERAHRAKVRAAATATAEPLASPQHKPGTVEWLTEVGARAALGRNVQVREPEREDIARIARSILLGDDALVRRAYQDAILSGVEVWFGHVLAVMYRAVGRPAPQFTREVNRRTVGTTGKLLIELAEETLRIVEGVSAPQIPPEERASIRLWNDGGAVSYVISDDLADALAATDPPLGELAWSDVPYPAPVFYVEFESHAIYMAGSAMHGILVCQGRDGADRPLEGLLLVFFGYRPDGMLVTIRGSVKAIQGETITASIARDVSDGLYLDARWMEQEDADIRDVLQDVYKDLVNVCLYLAHRPGAIRHAASEYAAAAREAKSRKSVRKQDKALRRAERLSRYDRYIVHVDAEGEKYKREMERALEDARHGVRFHHVRGHWRNQACGVKRLERERIWIRPHVRGDAALGTVRKIRSDAPVRAKIALEDRTRFAKEGAECPKEP